MSPIASPARSSALAAAGTGPMPMIRGGTPAVAALRTRASGRRPCASAYAREVSSSAPAPSLSVLELPAVTVPSRAKAGRSRASDSSEESRRGTSSASTTVLPLRPGTSTGTSSSAKRPASSAATAFAWLRSANASCSSRPMPCSSARFSAVRPSESVWPSSSMRGFTSRQPSVVSAISTGPVGYARAGLGTTNGARLIDSTPPAT